MHAQLHPLFKTHAARFFDCTRWTFQYKLEITVSGTIAVCLSQLTVKEKETTFETAVFSQAQVVSSQHEIPAVVTKWS